MFREMRLQKQQLPVEEAVAILQTATSGVLGVSGDDGYPYTVPVSHVYDNGRLFFHCAVKGHKLDAIKRNAKVSFCVIQQDEVIPEALNTLYRSVIVFGQARSCLRTVRNVQPSKRSGKDLPRLIRKPGKRQ